MNPGTVCIIRLGKPIDEGAVSIIRQLEGKVVTALHLMPHRKGRTDLWRIEPSLPAVWSDGKVRPVDGLVERHLIPLVPPEDVSAFDTASSERCQDTNPIGTSGQCQGVNGPLGLPL
jgi:hypothetical protein